MDIRLVRGRRSRVWLWVGLLAGGGVLVLAVTLVFGGDRTMESGQAVGAEANFGAHRGEVLPMMAEPFESLLPLNTREIGRLVHLVGTAESPLRGGTVWVRSRGGRRILMRIDPTPEGMQMGPGAGISVTGYVQKLSRAEFDLWTDTLGVILPRPRPGAKFGDVPDTAFARIDSLFIRDFMVLVRPEGLRDSQSTADLRPDTTLTPRPAPAATASAPPAAAGAAAAPPPPADTAPPTAP
jgi:hypothetical protein